MANLEFQDFNIVDMDSPFTSANSSQDNRPPGSTRDTSKVCKLARLVSLTFTQRRDPFTLQSCAMF